MQAAALLLTADGRILDPNDLVSAEQPQSRDGSVRFAESPGEFRVDLDAVPAAAARIAIVLAVRPGLGPGTTFGVFASIHSWLADAAGQPLLVFPLPLASRGETAMILAELYRHQGQWKFRAVGQGFAAGYRRWRISACACRSWRRMNVPPMGWDSGASRRGREGLPRSAVPDSASIRKATC